MTTLRKVGFFFEMPPSKRKEDLCAMCRATADPEEPMIIAYLEAGCVYAGVPNVEEDIICDPPHIIGPTHIRTAKVWAWPETLAYYVRRHHIALPDDFVDHMRGQGWVCQVNPDVSQLTLEGEVSMG